MDRLEIKQVIVVRNDLRSKLRAGKLSSQVAHASMAAFLSGMEVNPVPNSCLHQLTLEMEHARHQWITNSFGKIVVKCKDEEELIEIYDRCKRMNSIPHALITDHGRTVFREPTITCLGIGPLPESMLAPLTGHLQLY